MSPMTILIVLWFAVLLLGVSVLYSCIRESAGYARIALFGYVERGSIRIVWTPRRRLINGLWAVMFPLAFTTIYLAMLYILAGFLAMLV